MRRVTRRGRTIVSKTSHSAARIINAPMAPNNQLILFRETEKTGATNLTPFRSFNLRLLPEVTLRAVAVSHAAALALSSVEYLRAAVSVLPARSACWAWRLADSVFRPGCRQDHQRRSYRRCPAA